MMLELNKIYCMDCLEGMKMLPDKSVDCIITDPPYGIGYCSRGSNDEKYREKVADTTGWDDYDLTKLPINEMLRILKNDSYMYIFSRWDCLSKLPKPDRLLIWFKNDYGMGNLSDWSPSYEVILCFKKGNPKIIGKRPQDVLVFHKVANFAVRKNTGNNKMFHPTEKPLKLISHIIEKSTGENKIVLDPFMGSGTTAVACKMLNRKFIGFEISPEYCRIANARIQKESNQKRLMGVI